MATWLITGCSTGLGRALASAVLDRGETVTVTARDAASVGDLARSYPRTALALPLDVTDGRRRTVGARRHEDPAEGGRQPGDPARAAQAIITAVRSPSTPRMLVLGLDALTWFREAMTELNADVDAWEQISLGTSFPR